FFFYFFVSGFQTCDLPIYFNVLKTESKVNGTWQKYDVKTASPSKATAYIGWAPDPWSLRVQSTTSFDVSDASSVVRRVVSACWCGGGGG
ncbi:hypothetical protein, partial [Escherichia coli]|uniref:hypothetical protein n=1 Tax=Escherichia coli TaxID=562 RepID=UPI002119115B